MPYPTPGMPCLPSLILCLESSCSSLKSHPSFSLRTSPLMAQAWLNLLIHVYPAPLGLPLSSCVLLCAIMVDTTGMTPFDRFNVPWTTVPSSGRTLGPAKHVPEFGEGGGGYCIYLSQLILHFFFVFASPSSRTLDMLSSHHLRHASLTNLLSFLPSMLHAIQFPFSHL